MDIQCLIDKEHNFVTDHILHGKPVRFFNTGYIWSNLRLSDTIVAALFWKHCSRSMWDCFAPYDKLLQ